MEMQQQMEMHGITQARGLNAHKASEAASWLLQRPRQDAVVDLCWQRQCTMQQRRRSAQAEGRGAQPCTLLLPQPTHQPPRLCHRARQNGRQRARQIGAGRSNGVPLLLCERQARDQVGVEGCNALQLH